MTRESGDRAGDGGKMEEDRGGEARRWWRWLLSEDNNDDGGGDGNDGVGGCDIVTVVFSGREPCASGGYIYQLGRLPGPSSGDLAPERGM